MRRVKVRVPEGLGKQVIDIAFAIGLRGAELQRVENFEPNGNTSPCEVVDTETSTPKAKLFIARVLEADFFDRNTCSVISRDARSVFGKDRLDTLTVPLVQPWPDVLEEQFGLFAECLAQVVVEIRE